MAVRKSVCPADRKYKPPFLAIRPIPGSPNPRPFRPQSSPNQPRYRSASARTPSRPLNLSLVSLVPPPRVNLTRFHGVFAPNSKYRSEVTPARRGKRRKRHSTDEAAPTPSEKRALMTWAKRLKRVFNIDIETCSECGGDVRVIACIQGPVVIQKILTHLDNTASSATTALLPDCRASPSLPAGLFD